MNNLRRMLGLAIFVSILALRCKGDFFAAEKTKQSRVQIDLRSLRGSQGTDASAADTVILMIQSGTGNSQVFRRQLGPSQSVVSFNVEVETGTASFAASVRSNTGALLYAGQVPAVDIKDNGFLVAIPLVAQGPVPAVSPDSALVKYPAPSAVFFVKNRGTDSLYWQWDSLPPCPSLGPLLVAPGIGGLSVGESTSVVVTRFPTSDSSTTLCPVRFTSAVGYVNVKVVAAP